MPTVPCTRIVPSIGKRQDRTVPFGHAAWRNRPPRRGALAERLQAAKTRRAVGRNAIQCPHGYPHSALVVIDRYQCTAAGTNARGAAAASDWPPTKPRVGGARGSSTRSASRTGWWCSGTRRVTPALHNRCGPSRYRRVALASPLGPSLHGLILGKLRLFCARLPIPGTRLPIPDIVHPRVVHENQRQTLMPPRR